MGAAECRHIVADEAENMGWQLEKLSFRKCSAVLKNPSTGQIVEPQWGATTDESGIRSAVRMFISIDGREQGHE